MNFRNILSERSQTHKRIYIAGVFHLYKDHKTGKNERHYSVYGIYVWKVQLPRQKARK